MFKRLTMGLLGAAAVAASVILIRAQKEELQHAAVIPPGETVPSEIHPEKLRELGI